MLRLNKITLTQFKNYPLSAFHINERVIGICGLNGRGKTNLLDAIYYCCFTKSYFSRTDGLAVQFDQDGFRLESLFEKHGEEQNIICIYRGVGRKELSLNEVPYERSSRHIGKFPVVMIAPDDIELISGGGEERRRFMDTSICSLQQKILFAKPVQQVRKLVFI